MKRTQLNIHVQGLNLMNEYTSQIVPQLLEAIKGLIGVKIFLADGGKSKKLAAITLPNIVRGLDAATDTFLDYGYYLTSSYGILQMRINLCINGGSYDVKPSTAFTQYFEKTLHLGDIEDGILNSLVTTEAIMYNSALNKRYDEAGILAAVDNYNEKAKELEVLKNKVPHEIRHLFYIK